MTMRYVIICICLLLVRHNVRDNSHSQVMCSVFGQEISLQPTR